MVAYRTFADIEAICSFVIRQASTALGSRVYSSVPKTPTYPLAIVGRMGGTSAERHSLDMANVQVDVWGTNKSVAFDAAGAARRALHAMEGTIYTTADATPAPVNATVSGVEDSLGMTWLPDPLTAKDRYTFAVNVYFY